MQIRFGRLAKVLGPVIAIAFAASLSGCNKMNFTINGEDGKKLSELDLTGSPPDELVLLGPDEVRVTPGDKLTIRVDGDPEAKEHLRFTLKDGSLGILRDEKLFDRDGKIAIITVTMPAPKEVTMAGSGKITAPQLASKAHVTVAGSGIIESDSLAGESLDLTIAGSGSFRAAGNVKSLDLTIAGSGSAALDALKVDKADVSIAGSGSTAFMSDGKVDASIMGSGNVTVKGRATCTVSSMGSGTLTCEGGVHDADKDDDASEAPKPPAPPAPPAPPKP